MEKFAAQGKTHVCSSEGDVHCSGRDNCSLVGDICSSTDEVLSSKSDLIGGANEVRH
jgi:hypothetical protein